MSKSSSVSFGPGAASLILIFVVLTMSVLGMLALMSARNDLRLSERSAQVTEAVYALQARAEETRAAVDAALAEAAAGALSEEEYHVRLEALLPENTALEDGCVVWTETDGSRAIDCALEVLPLGGAERARYIRFDLSAETGEVW